MTGCQTHFHEISLEERNFLECENTDTWLENHETRKGRADRQALSSAAIELIILPQ